MDQVFVLGKNGLKSTIEMQYSCFPRRQEECHFANKKKQQESTASCSFLKLSKLTQNYGKYRKMLLDSKILQKNLKLSTKYVIEV